MVRFVSMDKPKFLPIVDQVASYLRDKIQRGFWGETIPGMNSLASELGVNAKTVEAALRMLEKQGILESQGAGRKRRINRDQIASKSSGLRVQMFLYEKSDQKLYYLIEILHLLQAAGHHASFATKTLTGLGADLGRVASFVESTDTDAWVVVSSSRDVLEWFAEQGTPAFALFGRAGNVPLASIAPKKAEAFIEGIERLVKLGHRRIVYLVREERRKPTPGFMERLFLEQLEIHGIQAGVYNLPDWEESPEGLQALLSSLLELTPPTAMIIDGSVLYHAVRSHLGNKGFSVPDDISLICTDPDPSFPWCTPAVTHIEWDFQPFVQRVVKWVDNISLGKDDRRKSSMKSKLVVGGTMGSVPRSSE